MTFLLGPILLCALGAAPVVFSKETIDFLSGRHLIIGTADVQYYYDINFKKSKLVTLYLRFPEA